MNTSEQEQAATGERQVQAGSRQAPEKYRWRITAGRLVVMGTNRVIHRQTNLPIPTSYFRVLCCHSHCWLLGLSNLKIDGEMPCKYSYLVAIGIIPCTQTNGLEPQRNIVYHSHTQTDLCKNINIYYITYLKQPLNSLCISQSTEHEHIVGIEQLQCSWLFQNVNKPQAWILKNVKVRFWLY